MAYAWIFLGFLGWLYAHPYHPTLVFPAWVYYLLATVVFGSAMGLYTAIERVVAPAGESATDVARIAKREAGLATPFSGLDPRRGLGDRLDLFLLRTLRLDRKLEEMHMLLGRPDKPTPVQLLHYKELAAAAAGALLALASHSIPAAALATAGGFFIPDFFIKNRVKQRQQEIMRQFPAFVDLAALTIEAGLDYMTAIERILKNAKKKTELEVELGKVVSEISLGYSRRDALSHLALRTGLQEIRSFVGLIVQSDELGTSLVDLLRNYAGDMRFRRLNRAEKLAAQASTKMLFPLIFFIFPPVFILLMSPMIKSFFKGGLGF